MITSTTVRDKFDLVAYQAWTNRGAAPAYMRGLPTWVWQAALCRRRFPSRAVSET